MYQIPWDSELRDIFFSEAILTDFEKEVATARMDGVPRLVIARKHNLTVEAIDYTIRRIRRKYDLCAKKNPRLPTRVRSGVWGS